MLHQDLPAVNQRVDVWFDGYDDYYGGRVDSVTRPYKFHVVLDDDSKWNLDTRKHVFQLSSPVNQSEDQSNTVARSPPVRRASTANARKSVGSKPAASQVGTPGSAATRRTRSRRASAPDPSFHLDIDTTSLADGVDTPADSAKDSDISTRRRTSGRALRKNTAGPRPPPESVESSPSGSSSVPASNARAGPRAGTRQTEEVAEIEEYQEKIDIVPAPTVSLVDDVDDVDKSAQEPAPKAGDKTFPSAAAAALAADAADERDNKQLGAVSFIKDSTNPSVLSPVPPSPATAAAPVSHSSFLSSFSLHPPPLLSPPTPAPKTPSPLTRRTSSRTAAAASPVKSQKDSPRRSDGETQSGGNLEVDNTRGPLRTRSGTQTRSLAVGAAQDEVLPSLPLGRRKRGPPSTMSDSASDDDASKGGRLRSTKKRRLARRDGTGGIANDGGTGEGSEASLTASPPVSPANVPSPSTRRRSSVTFRDEVEVFPTSPRFEGGNVKAKGSMAKPVTSDKPSVAIAVAGSDSEIETEGENDVGSSSDVLRSGIEGNGHSNTLENVSAKVITALAVDAALEAVKTVVEPLNERVENLLRELSSVSRDLVSQKKQLESELSSTISALNTIAEASAKADAKEQEEEQVPPGPRKAVGRPPAAARGGASATDPKEKGKTSGIPQAVTISALQNFQLDISEVIGGGEARLRMHASLSHQEFESLHRLIEHQGKSLAELDRLLYAAQKFARKADDVGNDIGMASTAANGNGNGLDAGRTKNVTMDVDKESGGN